MGEALNPARVLSAGGLAVFPTETVWGIGCLLSRPEAVARLVSAKGRDPSKPLQVLSLAPWHLADLSGGCGRALAALGVTVVARPIVDLPALGGDGETVGVRIPSHPAVVALLEQTGPIVASSANKAGRPTPQTLEEVRAVFGDAVDVYADGAPPSGVASAVVDVTCDPPRLLRDGAPGLARIRRSCPDLR